MIKYVLVFTIFCLNVYGYSWGLRSDVYNWMYPRNRDLQTMIDIAEQALSAFELTKSYNLYSYGRLVKKEQLFEKVFRKEEYVDKGFTVFAPIEIASDVSKEKLLSTVVLGEFLYDDLIIFSKSNVRLQTLDPSTTLGFIGYNGEIFLDYRNSIAAESQSLVPFDNSIDIDSEKKPMILQKPHNVLGRNGVLHVVDKLE